VGGGGFHDGGLLFTHANLPLPTMSSHLSFHSFRFSSLVVQSTYTLVDLLNLSGLCCKVLEVLSKTITQSDEVKN
jgi:hypothetical protein